MESSSLSDGQGNHHAAMVRKKHVAHAGVRICGPYRRPGRQGNSRACAQGPKRDIRRFPVYTAILKMGMHPHFGDPRTHLVQRLILFTISPGNNKHICLQCRMRASSPKNHIVITA